MLYFYIFANIFVTSTFNLITVHYNAYYSHAFYIIYSFLISTLILFCLLFKLGFSVLTASFAMLFSGYNVSAIGLAYLMLLLLFPLLWLWCGSEPYIDFYCILLADYG